MNNVVVILANNHLQDKLESILHETNSWIGYQATLKEFCQTDIGKVYKKMIDFGYSADIENIRLEMDDYSSYFTLPSREELLSIAKEFKEVEDSISTLWKVLNGNIGDKLIGWMYEWIETVAYVYDHDKWNTYKMLYESLDVSFVEIITGEGVAQAEQFLLEELKGAH